MEFETALDVTYDFDALGDMTPADYLNELRRECSKPGRGWIDHPFVLALEAGTVTMSQLRFFAGQNYLRVRNVIPFVGYMACSCPIEEARNTLIKGLVEEAFGAMTGTKAHPELFLDFCVALGMDPEATRRKRQLTASRRVTDYHEFLSRCRPWYVPAAAIGAVMEASVPDVFARMITAFKANYGLTDAQLQFWITHIKADKDHGDEGVGIVERHVTTPEARIQVFECAVVNAENMYGMFDIYRDVS